MNEPQKKRSPWVYIGCGCGGLVLLGLIAAGGIGYYVQSKVKDLVAEMKDPVARTARSRQILGAQELPAGYYASVSVSIPLVMDMTMLSDRPPDDSGELEGFNERGFLYFKLLSASEDREALWAFYEGRSDDPAVLEKTKIKLKVKELIRRGQLDLSGRKVFYVAQRADTDTGQVRANGLTTLVLFDCGADQKMRMGIWFGEDPHPEMPAAQADFTGTVADEGEMKSFLAHFEPCGA